MCRSSVSRAPSSVGSMATACRRLAYVTTGISTAIVQILAPRTRPSYAASSASRSWVRHRLQRFAEFRRGASFDSGLLPGHAHSEAVWSGPRATHGAQSFSEAISGGCSMRSITLALVVTLVLMPATTIWADEVNPALMTQVIKAVKSELRDPDSVRIISTNLKHTKDANGNPADVVCGTLTAKKPSGGISDEVPFVYWLKSNNAYVIETSIVSKPFLVNDRFMAYHNVCP